MSGMRLKTYDAAKGFAWAVGGILVTTGVFWLFRRSLDPGQASLLYLPVVIACALRFGFAPALAGAVLSFFFFNLFLFLLLLFYFFNFFNFIFLLFIRSLKISKQLKIEKNI